MHGWFVCPTVSMVTTSHATGLEKTIRHLADDHWVIRIARQLSYGRSILNMFDNLIVMESPGDVDHRKSTLARGSRWDYTPLPF